MERQGECSNKRDVMAEMENDGGNMMKEVNETNARDLDTLLRVLALVVTLIAIIVISVSQETKLVPVTILPNLPPLNVPAIAKWQYSSAAIYFFIANVAACVYAASSLVLSMLKLVGTNIVIFVLDLVVMALLFSSIGAVAAIGVLGYKGNVHLKWESFCDVFDKFCRFTVASIAVSLFGALIFLMLVVLTALHIRKKRTL